LRLFPPSYEIEKANFSWDQLTLGVDSLNLYAEIVEDFWGKAILVLSEERDVEIKGPEDEGWFHLRRTAHGNTEQSALEYAQGRIEILRLKRGFITQQTQERIRLLPIKHTEVICAGWWPLSFSGRHDNAFLSFLQRLSVLRGRDRIFYPGFLANIANEYDRCPHCQEAYRIMMTPLV
jgi:hypothetical protein